MKHETRNKKNASGFRLQASRSRGFTLIEAVVYAAIFAVLSVLVISSIITLTKSFGLLRAAGKINSSAVSALERMTREIRLAEGIDVSASDFGLSPGKLVLNSKDRQSGENLKIEFYLVSSTVMIKKAAGSAEPLTSSGAEVSRLIFRNLAGSSNSEAVSIEMEIKVGQKSEKFYNSAVLRRSY